MNRIDNTLQHAQLVGKKLLSPYITAGDPSPEATLKAMHAWVNAGADILEIGIPFSDPMAEGPVIQAAMERALANGMTCHKVFELIARFRKDDTETPIVLMGYLNTIEQLGYQAFSEKAKQAGVDGTIIVDMPPEENEGLASIWKDAGLYMIYLCSPTTTDERMALIHQEAKGYLYYVSLKGVTGSNTLDVEALEKAYRQRKAQTHLPLFVGFGIKSAEMAARVGQFADGVIVGAALIETIQNSKNPEQDGITQGAAFLHSMRKAMDEHKV